MSISHDEQFSGTGEVLLEVSDLVVGYGKILALRGVSFTVRAGELVTLLGSNGAGKTTTMRALSGLLAPESGKVRYSGEDITKMPTHHRVDAGIIAVPEGRGIFAGMTVQENLDMGCYSRTFGSRRAYAAELERVYGLFPRLADRRTQLGGSLSGGEQQMLAMGRALMARPHLLLLDEPSMGLAPMMIEQVFAIIGDINRAGTAILLVEQNANAALDCTDRAYVLETGKIVHSGTGEELLADPAVKAAYLGVA
jgi:branched-chain amino acid transport system ATP-binding protein